MPRESALQPWHKQLLKYRVFTIQSYVRTSSLLHQTCNPSDVTRGVFNREGKVEIRSDYVPSNNEETNSIKTSVTDSRMRDRIPT